MATRAFTKLCEACSDGRTDVVRSLLSRGVRPDRGALDEFTPVLLAAQHGHARVVQLLLDSGCSVSRASDRDMGPLHVACAFGHATVVTALLEAGAEPSERTKDGATPVTLARRYGHRDIVLLLEARSEPERVVPPRRRIALVAPTRVEPRIEHMDLEFVFRAPQVKYHTTIDAVTKFNILNRGDARMLLAVDNVYSDETLARLRSATWDLDPIRRGSRVDVASSTVRRVTPYFTHVRGVPLSVTRGSNVRALMVDTTTPASPQEFHYDLSETTGDTRYFTLIVALDDYTSLDSPQTEFTQTDGDHQQTVSVMLRANQGLIFGGHVEHRGGGGSEPRPLTVYQVFCNPDMHDPNLTVP